MTLPFNDRGLLLGDGLFETLLAVDGDPSDWDAHLARLNAGCVAGGLADHLDGRFGGAGP